MMKKFFLFLCAAAMLAVPAFADSSPDAGSCEHYFEVTIVREAGCSETGLLSYVCRACGAAFSMEAPAAGHNYVYQYDAVRDEDGALLTYGTWRCVRCGDLLEATAGNAAYYYNSAEAPVQDVPAPVTASSSQQAEPVLSAAEARNGLWTAIAAGAAVLLIAEAAVLTRTLGRDRYGR